MGKELLFQSFFLFEKKTIFLGDIANVLKDEKEITPIRMFLS